MLLMAALLIIVGNVAGILFLSTDYWLRSTVYCSFLLVLFFSIVGYLGRAGKYFELASHFRVQYSLLSLCYLLIFAGLQMWVWALLASFCLFINAVVVLPWLTSRKQRRTQTPGRNVRVIQANVLYENRRYAPFKKLVDEEKPDILIAQEVTEEWLKEMEYLSETYPYVQAACRGLGGGIALFSRFPFLESEILPLGFDERPGIRARLRIDGTAISLFTFHPHAPLRRDHFRWRNHQLALAADLIKTMPAPLIVIGDLNTTMWSPYFNQLLRARELINVRQGFGILPTWPLWLLLPFLMLPIDHCFVSPDIAIHKTRTGKRTGSDHLPLIVDLTIPEMNTTERVSRSAVEVLQV
jgi:endonuclease/exonuclease/phosphatase (EEP) superfamily protein YafD